MICDLTDHARESLLNVPPSVWSGSSGCCNSLSVWSLTLSMQNWSIGLDEFQSMTGVLRVIVKKATDPLRVITCYFDRKMRRQL